MVTVDTRIIRKSPTEVSSRPDQETPHACMDGWVYMVFEGEDENGEPAEVIERVACRRCRPESL
jgi:hypothetical protein